MSREQAVLSQLDASAVRGVRPEKAQAALQEVPLLADELVALELELTRATEDAEETLRAAARHLVGSGGKRIRPTVTLLACGACSGTLRSAVPFACAAELTHSATLLHDDVIDDGPTRRGQPASRVLWGNAVSVLSGDWLLTRALEIVAAEPARSAALPALLATMRRLVEGEVLQLSLRGSFEATEQDYFDVVRGKTASLFGWSAAAGAWAAGMRGEVPDALAEFGEEIGMAFQLDRRRPRLRGRSEPCWVSGWARTSPKARLPCPSSAPFSASPPSASAWPRWSMARWRLRAWRSTSSMRFAGPVASTRRELSRASTPGAE